MKRIALLTILLLTIASVCLGQATPGFQATNNASAYSYSGTMKGEEQLKIYTYIWGQVKRPGLYIVPDNSDLLALLSLSGGPTEDAKLNNIAIIRPTAKGSEKKIIVDIEKYLETADENLIPVLQPGDTVLVSGTFFYAVTRVTDFISKIAIVLTVYIGIHNLNN